MRGVGGVYITRKAGDLGPHQWWLKFKLGNTLFFHPHKQVRTEKWVRQDSSLGLPYKLVLYLTDLVKKDIVQ